MTIYGDNGPNELNGTGGADTLVGLGGADVLYGGAGDDLLIGGEGPDVLYGNDTYTHGTDRDAAAYWDSPTGVYVDLTLGFGLGGTAEGDRLIDIENLYGSPYSDTLIGNAQDNYLDGGGSNDLLMGRDGNDNLFGGFGDDILEPGSGTDFVNGGADVDTVSYASSLRGMWASLLFNAGYTGDAAGDTYLSIENLVGSRGSDFLQGNNEANLLRGERGNDFLWGEDGDDRLVGGAQIDSLVGGAGADAFVWQATGETGTTIETADVILDFDPNMDLIDLQLIDADTKMTGDQAFEFIGSADFTAPGQVRWSIEGSDTVVWINTGGDEAPEAAIRLAGAPLLGESHFLL